MNDTHMSHAMEFPYPMSMSNCNTCHEGKLDADTHRREFHGRDLQELSRGQGIAWRQGEPGARTTRAGSPNRQAPLIQYLWDESGFAGIHDINHNCRPVTAIRACFRLRRRRPIQRDAHGL